jgi:inhibitor of cysteine peptidase
MKSKTTIFIAICTVMVIHIAVAPGLCAGEKQTVSKDNATYTDPEKTIQCNVGGTISIVLDSNPSTGYQWQLAHSPDGELLKLLNSTYRAPITELVGAGGKEIWSFKALSVGQRTIVFEYVRSWEKNKEPVKRTTFTVNIQ